MEKSDERVVEEAARTFRVLGDGPRLRLLSRLLNGEATVTELAQAEGESLSTISQRLRVLRSERVVVGRRRGKQVSYSLADTHIIELIRNVLGHAGEDH